ncbi:NADPH-dependent FMN reductase [Neisseria montereyensis]|uniref:NAD(P)H-dependent oxidoreductase n=1 Tax=Neisseria montereyensis TaxID=2973938 RepID=A0ABT2FCH7_9NEIS|nr:NAD(P)H-dependent oxidoreductase [Neisseria montereyensis]MCS4533861.1 NAD(P)H-dependent oxidoreductase [Neisseria montereyensis]
MTIIAFAGSNSSTSLNQALVNYVSGFSSDIEVICLKDYPTPLYSMDIEKADGVPQETVALYEKLQPADKLIISVSEHNGNMTAFFKSHLDWLSRKERTFLKDKKVLLLSASPGPGGAAHALEIAKTTLPHFGAEIVDTYSIKKFNDVFQDGKITDETIANELKALVNKLINS